MEAEIGRKEVDREVFGHGLQDGYLSFNPHVKGGPFPLRGCDGVPIVRSTRDWCQSLFRIFSWTHRCLAEEYSENSTECAREQFPNFLTKISFGDDWRLNNVIQSIGENLSD